MTITVTVTSPAPVGSDGKLVDFLLNAAPNTAGDPPNSFTAHDATITLGSATDLVIESLDTDPFSYDDGAVTGGTVDRILVKSSSDGLTRIALSGLNIDAAALYDAMIANDEASLATLLFSSDSFNFTGDSGDDAFTAGEQDDTLDGGAGNDRLAGGDGMDTVLGGEGDDDLYVNNSNALAGETYNGGGGSDDLYVSGTNDFTGATLMSIEGLRFGAGGGSATFTSDQIGGAALSATLAVEGDADPNEIVVNMTAASLNIRLGPSPTGSWKATIAIIGSADGDTIVGTSQNDTINGDAGDDTITVFAGEDTVDGGDGDNDRLIVNYAATTTDVAGSDLEGSASFADSRRERRAIGQCRACSSTTPSPPAAAPTISARSTATT